MTQNYLEFAKKLALESGKIISDNFYQANTFDIKSDNSEVTKTDIDVNDLVIQRINEEYPDHSILGEEKSSKGSSTEYVWVCDPIDGTLPFIQGVPSAVFSLALVKNGKPIVGVIYEPILKKMYFAEKGKGAFLNGEIINVSKRNDIGKSVVEFCWTKDFKRFDASDLIANAYKTVGVITNHHAIIFAGSLIAQGKIDGLVFVKHTAHDAASIKIIVEEAGGKVTSLNGDDQRYDEEIDGMIASNSLIHEDLVELFMQTKRLV